MRNPPVLSLHPKQSRVHILNPPYGGNTSTTVFRAARAVAQGRAHMDCFGRLVYHRAPGIIEVDREIARAVQRAEGPWSPTLATEQALRHTPVVMPGKLLGRGQNTGGRAGWKPSVFEGAYA